MKIVTSFIYPPIPLRQFDWCAYREGEEERGPRGYGRTEAEAIADLKEMIEAAEEDDSTLSAEDQTLIDAAWERHKAAAPKPST